MKNTTFSNSKIHQAITWLLISIFFLQHSDLAAAQRDGFPHEDDDDDNHAFDMQQPFNPSMAIIMIIVVSIFFCFGCLCVYIRRCAERRLSRNFNPASNFLRMQVPHGLDPEVIKTFPTFQYNMVKGHKIGKRALECAVCLNEFQDDEILRLLPKCSHVFHPDCIDAWLAFHTTCPVCRANLVPHPGDQPYAPLLAFDQSSSPIESDQPENQNSLDTEDQARAARSNTTSPIRAPSQSCSPIWSDGLKLNRLFPRSNSTGHSLVQPGADVERFTLRLPEDVRIQLMSTPFKRTRSFPRMKSPISGFKIGRPDRWGFSVTPPFIIKGSSAKSPCEGVTYPSPPKTSIRSAALKLLQGTDSVGEKSSDKPQADSQV